MSKPVSLVTGVSRGIGLATVHRLAREGHEVIGLSRSPPPEAIAPGPVVSELFEKNNTPELIAGVISFLLGPDAGYITGQTLFVCGGMSIGRSMI